MDDGVRQWVARTARANLWRVQNHYDVDDLIQEGYLCYLNVRRRYPDVHNPAHIMRLTQITFTNRIHDLARRKGVEREVMITESIRSGGRSESEGSILTPSAPDYIRRFIQLAAESAERLRTPYTTHAKGKGRETTHRHICRLLALRVAETPELPLAIKAFLKE